MATTIVASATARAAAAAEYLEIHLAVCRSRRQGLCCSTCTELSGSYERLAARAGIQTREAA